MERSERSRFRKASMKPLAQISHPRSTTVCFQLVLLLEMVSLLSPSLFAIVVP